VVKPRQCCPVLSANANCSLHTCLSLGNCVCTNMAPLFIRPEASIKSVCADSVLVYTLGRLNKTKYKTHTATNAKTAQIYTRNRRTGLPELQVDGDNRTFPCCSEGLTHTAIAWWLAIAWQQVAVFNCSSIVVHIRSHASVASANAHHYPRAPMGTLLAAAAAAY
jgi:hypothetical protein